MNADATIQRAIAQLETERKQIESTIAALRAALKTRTHPRIKGASGAAKAAGKRPGRRKMSAAQKKAVSLRMKKYWAARKKKAAK